MYPFRLLITIIALMSFTPPSFSGGNSGGGGLFMELDLAAVQAFLRKNCESFESFKSHKVDCPLFQKKIDDVGSVGKGLSIRNTPLLLDDGKAVDAINQLPGTIAIGQSGWKEAGADISLKIGLYAHEILSLMGLESTGHYSISSELLTELRDSRRFGRFDSGLMSALSWLRSQFHNGGRRSDVLLGWEKATGRRCGLFLTNRSFSAEEYYVVVGYEKSDDAYDYIGVMASKSAGLTKGSGLVLRSDDSWGNSTKFNKIRIKFNLFARPLKVEGRSDKKVITCILD
jgi:hypothetical protein